ncbi:MAG: hypothetical protein ACFFAN_16090 [Promethearchaeota archaeon]
MKNRNKIFMCTLVYLAWLLISSTSATTIDNSSEKASNKTEWINEQPEEGDNSATALENQASGNLNENESPKPASTVLFTEDFNHGGLIPDGWSRKSTGIDERPWVMVLGSGSGDYNAMAYSIGGVNITEWLCMETDYIDCSDYTSVELEFYMDYDYHDGSDEYAMAAYTTSTKYPTWWYSAQKWDEENVQGTQILDLSFAAGDPEVRIAFVYRGTDDYRMIVDDVILRGEEQNDGNDNDHEDDDDNNGHKKSDDGIGGGVVNFLLSPIGLIAVGGITAAVVAVVIVVWVIKKRSRR